MARFPIREAEIMRLAREMIAGFRQRPQDFPSLFVPVEIQRRRKRAAWEDVATSTATEIELDHQERGVEYEYRVLGINKAGEGRPSSVVRAVL